MAAGVVVVISPLALRSMIQPKYLVRTKNEAQFIAPLASVAGFIQRVQAEATYTDDCGCWSGTEIGTASR
jgi:hypothetical protein